MSESSGMKIVTILGSVSPGSYTAKALVLAEDELAKQHGITAVRIDPAGLRLALPGQAVEGNDAEAVRQTVASATGVILATPEYHGSYSSTIKLVIDNLGFPSMLSGKPVALLGVAAGRIGAIKATEHLRSVCAHVGAIALPMPISVANCQSVFAEDGTCKDPEMEKAVRSVGTNLVHYIQNNICPRVTLEAMMRGEKVFA